jgi:hypothetical protein
LTFWIVPPESNKLDGHKIIKILKRREDGRKVSEIFGRYGEMYVPFE